MEITPLLGRHHVSGTNDEVAEAFSLVPVFRIVGDHRTKKVFDVSGVDRFPIQLAQTITGKTGAEVDVVGIRLATDKSEYLQRQIGRAHV